MERIASDEEKIRRAIEISQRRNQNYNNRETARVNVSDKKQYKLFKKMILQIIICLLIYIIFYLISTTNYVFSEELMNGTSNILSYDINLQKVYIECEKFFANIFNVKNDNEMDTSAATSITNNITNQIKNNIDENIESSNLVENVVAIDVKEENVSSRKEESEEQKIKKNEKTAMEKDAEEVKKICKFQKPLRGTITSEFGAREATIEGMTTDHKGIDIAANLGTSIKAAMAGTVSVAEENSEYGKFIKITNGDIMTVYAHCKTLKVKVGDKIKLGQTIATVGSTGNSTGPHLHFEIRLENRYITPKYEIDF